MLIYDFELAITPIPHLKDLKAFSIKAQNTGNISKVYCKQCFFNVKECVV